MIRDQIVQREAPSILARLELVGMVRKLAQPEGPEGAKAAGTITPGRCRSTRAGDDQESG